MQWESWLLTHEIEIRLSAFVGVLLLMSTWELLSPCRELHHSRMMRWLNNLSLVFLNTLLLRLLFPAAAVGIAHFAQTQQWGLFNWLSLPAILEVLLAVVLLDMLIYFQHVVFHKVPMLWRLHRVHHADPDYDLTTGIRFHPIEIILSMLIKMAAILLFGPAAVAVLIFEVLLNGSAMFNHANIQLPKRVDAVVRWLFVTPDMHRVHHSWIRTETDSNFGFSLSIWDRLFSTYKAQPQAGHKGMDIGLPEFTNEREVSWLTGMLKLPFRR